MRTRHPRQIAAMLAFASLGSVMLAAPSAPAPARVSTSSATPGSLEAGFANPPRDARPGTWFHVMSGNMTREGLTRDLESMAAVGIGNVTMFHVTQGIPIGRVQFASDEHIALVAHAAAEAARLGLIFGVHNSDGWTSSGGPWVTAEQSMKRVVWSETVSDGGAVSLRLAQPPTLHDYYRDIATLAWPADADQNAGPGAAARFTGTGTQFDARLVSDNSYARATSVGSVDGTAAVTVDFGAARPVAHIDMMVEDGRTIPYAIAVSDDGRNWRTVAQGENARSGKNEATVTASFAPVSARFVRISSNADFSVKELRLETRQRVPGFYTRSSLANPENRQGLASLASHPDAAALPVIDPARIINLSDRVGADGTLTATLPPGRWIIQRFGYTTTGAVNVPASAEGTGLEVDKFSPAAIELHYNAYIHRIVTAARAIRADAMRRTIIDSYEVGGQNWTQGYEALFRSATGQDIVRYLPLYSGHAVGSIADTDNAYDAIRRLNSDLMRDNYFGHFRRLAHADGLEVYAEAYGFGPFNEMDAAREADIPMGEFWLGRPQEQTASMISAAHIYGRRDVAAEAFTAMPELNWRFHPAVAKTRGDLAWTQGINAFVFHRFAHQANTHVAPGMTMNRWGSHIDRHQPWWNSAGAAWFAYMARGQHMLRQGYAVADLAYFVGDMAPNACPNHQRQSSLVPQGYRMDCINADVLLNRSRLADGRLMLPEGNGYSIVMLGNRSRMTPATLARLVTAAEAGVTVVGDQPEALLPAGLTVTAEAAARRDFTALWRRLDAVPSNQLGSAIGGRLAPDFQQEGDAELPFMHRRSGGTDIYFTFNPAETPREVLVSLRSSAAAPQIWDPMDGSRRIAAGASTSGGRTLVPLTLAAGQSAFIVLGAQDAASPRPTPAQATATLALSGQWSAAFVDAFGERFTLPPAPLADLATHSDARARNFAGTVTYRTTVNITPAQLRSARFGVIDLGQVAVDATVRVNGQRVGTSWMPPHRLDIRRVLRPGTNRIEIAVATLWVNRLIADAALPDTSGFVVADRSNNPTTRMVDWYANNRPPPAGPRRSFSTQPFQRAGDDRVPAGLIGPVSITLSR